MPGLGDICWMRPGMSLKPGLLGMPDPLNCGRGCVLSFLLFLPTSCPGTTWGCTKWSLFLTDIRAIMFHLYFLEDTKCFTYLRCVPAWSRVAFCSCSVTRLQDHSHPLHCHKPPFHFFEYQALIFIRWVKVCKESTSKPFRRPIWDLCNFIFFFNFYFSFSLFKQKYDFPPPQQCN